MLCKGYLAPAADESSPLFIAFLSLLNLYLYLIAYLYAPSVDGLADLQFKQARKEHEHIMNQFYEQELPDITRETIPEGADKGVTVTEGPVKQAGAEKRGRYIKKDPQQKAKEKLWESIIKETEDENSSDTSEEENEI